MRPVVKRPITIKLVILYIMDKYRNPIPESVLSNIMLGDIEVNYFDYRESVAVLERTKYIHTFFEEGKETHALTVDGKELIDEMYSRVAYQLRTDITGYIKREKLKLVKSREFSCEIVPRNDVDFSVNIVYREADEDLLSVTFFAGNRTSAEAMRKVLIERKTRFFAEINKAIAETVEAEPGENKPKD